MSSIVGIPVLQGGEHVNQSYAMYHAALREGSWVYLWVALFSVAVGFCMTHRRTRPPSPPSSSPSPNVLNR